jgi:hypothetical protein
VIDVGRQARLTKSELDIVDEVNVVDEVDQVDQVD